jgi:hypothetical protein
VEDGGGKQRGRFFSNFQTWEGEDGDVVIPPEGGRSFRGVGLCSEEVLQTVKAVNFAGSTASF